MIGTQLGPYEILAPLGAGGMGEVYRAKDSRLKREVAIKILPAEAFVDPQKLKRFEQEAQAASALNHPNILVVYDIGSENGTHFIVSELVDGDPLRKIIRNGPVPTKRLLDLAAQIADGLAAAHQAGIVHRDLKPENIMVTRDGRVKILDFGLAKLRTQMGSEEDETVSRALSHTGMIQGTVPYMSPEQASAKSVDFRSDQFSFGLILYEMATGKRAFAGSTAAETLSAIIKEEPASITTLNPKIPAPLRWLIERCLAKEVHQRYGATIDLYHDLRNLRDHLTETTSADTIVEAPAAKRFSKGVFAALIILASLIAGLLVSQFFLQPELIDTSSYRFTPVADEAFYESLPSWSLDGKSIVYNGVVDGMYQIFTKAIDSPVATQITKSPDSGVNPFWSPDGTRIFYGSEGAIWSIGTGGGEAQQVLKNAAHATISPDGKTFAFLRGQNDTVSVWISSNSAPPEEYKQSPFGAKKFEQAMGLRFSPDGSKIAIWGILDKSSKSEFWILPYPSGKPRLILPALSKVVSMSSFNWMPDSRHLVFSSYRLGNSEIHVADTEKNTIRQITSTISIETTPAVSPDGKKIAFSVMEESADLVEVPLNGSPVRDLLATSRIESRALWSPLRNQFAYVKGRMGVEGIWLRSPDEGWERPVVTAKDFGNEITELFEAPQFSPDGQRISYMRIGEEKYAIWISPVGGGAPVRLVQGMAHSWSPDGNWIVFIEGNAAQLDLFKIRVGSRNDPIKLISGKGLYETPLWSPKNDWITYITEEGLHLVSPDGQKTTLLTKEIPMVHGWSKDGSRLFVIKSNEKKRRVLVSIQIQSGKEEMITDLGLEDPFWGMFGFSLAPDGKSFATTTGHEKSDIWILEGFDERPGFFDRFWKRK